MTKEEIVELLRKANWQDKKPIKKFNRWRRANPTMAIDLSYTDLMALHASGINLRGARGLGKLLQWCKDYDKGTSLAGAKLK